MGAGVSILAVSGTLPPLVRSDVVTQLYLNITSMSMLGSTDRTIESSSSLSFHRPKTLLDPMISSQPFSMWSRRQATFFGCMASYTHRVRRRQGGSSNQSLPCRTRHRLQATYDAPIQRWRGQVSRGDDCRWNGYGRTERAPCC